jgi:peptide/nickel transport system substrate-binding protein
VSESDSSNYWQRLSAGRLNRRRALGSGAAGLGALALAACGGSNNNTSKNSNSASNSATQAATQAASAAATSAATKAAAVGSPTAAGSPSAGAAAKPTLMPANSSLKTGGTIQGQIAGTANLDPVANTTYRSSVQAGFHYSRLFRFASGPDPATNLARTPIGDLVTGYELTADGMQYTMKLRQDAIFHPPLSRPLTSADVLASYQYFSTNPLNTNSNVYTNVGLDTVTAPDANTIVFKLKAPYAPFINKLANTQYLWILSADAVNGKIDPAQQAIGTGPWIYISTTPTAFTWKKNPNYFIKGLPYADGAVLNVIPDASTYEAQFSAGSIDSLAIPSTDLANMIKQTPKANSVTYAPAGLAFFFFSNVSDPASPFHDPRMRQAASLALDRDGVIKSIFGGVGVYCNIVPPGLGKWYLDPQGKDIGDAAQWFKYDPQKAKQLIAAAGHTDTQLKYIYPNNAYGDVYNSQADTHRGMLTDAGFKLNVVTVDYLKDYINNGQGIFNKGAPPNSIVFALQSGFSDPDDYLSGMLTKGGNRDHDLMDDPDIAAAVKKQQVEFDENKRQTLVYDATRMADNAMWYVPTEYQKTVIVTQPWVQNYFVSDDYNYGTQMYAYMSVNNK